MRLRRGSFCEKERLIERGRESDGEGECQRNRDGGAVCENERLIEVEREREREREGQRERERDAEREIDR